MLRAVVHVLRGGEGDGQNACGGGYRPLVGRIGGKGVVLGVGDARHFGGVRADGGRLVPFQVEGDGLAFHHPVEGGCDFLLRAVVDEAVAVPCQLELTLGDGEGLRRGQEVEVAALSVGDCDGGIARVGVGAVGDRVLGGRDCKAAHGDGDGRLMLRAVVHVLRGGEGDGQNACGGGYRPLVGRIGGKGVVLGVGDARHFGGVRADGGRLVPFQVEGDGLAFHHPVEGGCDFLLRAVVDEAVAVPCQLELTLGDGELVI